MKRFLTYLHPGPFRFTAPAPTPTPHSTSFVRRHAHTRKPFLGLSHLSERPPLPPQPQKQPRPKMLGSDTEEASHINKKPRLEKDVDAPSVELRLAREVEMEDAPVDAMSALERPAEMTETPAPGSVSGPAPGPSLLGALSSMITGQLDAPKKARKVQKGGHKRIRVPEPYSKEDTIWKEVVNLIGREVAQKAIAEGAEWDTPFELYQELDVTVSCLSGFGESLALAPKPFPPWVIVTPFALPGEIIRARIYWNSRLCSHADLVKVIKPNPELRDDSRVQCKYFRQCSGCQYQMLSYEKQLELKRDVIVKAYEHYADLPPESVPEILPTLGSELQYGYRTKLTPHFDFPRSKAKKLEPTNGVKPDWFNIGFNKIGKRQVLDIEECPIATPTINEALGPLRTSIFEKLHTYRQGASLLLRESLAPPEEGSSSSSSSDEKRICVTNHKATVRERVGDTLFEYGASSFFQNNNSVLVPLTSYVRDCIFPSSPPSPLSSSLPRPTHLVDAYCGSGLFALTLAPHFTRVVGIELSQESITAATRNATTNRLSHLASFIEGDASHIFTHVASFPRERTVLVIDPPRKGSDEKFIDQLVEYGCGTVVYVSCNVHTQARDVGMILRKSEERGRVVGSGRRYVVESLRGFDLFPQTAHVESVAVLRLMGTGEVAAEVEAAREAETKAEEIRVEAAS